MRFTAHQARAFLAIRHFENPNLTDDPVTNVIDTVRALGCIQYDPLNVVGRNADLTLQSRIPGYRAEHLRSALYERRALVDGFDKVLAIYPAEDFPAFSRARRDTCAWFRENETIRAALPGVIEEVRTRGALCSDDLPLNEKVRWPWGEARLARAALETLWMEGRLGLAKREGARRYYDLIERCLPQGVPFAPDPFPQDEQFEAWLVKRRVGAVGLLWNRASDAFLTYTGHIPTDKRNAAFKRLADTGEIEFVGVEGQKSEFAIRKEDLPLAKEVLAGREPANGMRALAPLDPLLWDRKLIKALFGFHYSWEVYTPVVKRQYGYYVLPVMLGAEFVGRFEPKPYRGGKLEILNWWKEPGVKETGPYRHEKALWRARFEKYLKSCVQ